MKKAVALALCTAFASSAYAGATDSGVYIGGGFGLTESKMENVDESRFPTLDGERAFKVYGGYQFNRIVAIEAGYTHYGKLGTSSDTDASASPTSLSLAANLGYTFDIGLRPFATIGLSRVGMELKDNGQAKDDWATGLRYGVGVEYSPQMIDGLAMRLAYEMDAFNVEVAPDNTDVFTVGGLYLGASYKF